CASAPATFNWGGFDCIVFGRSDHATPSSSSRSASWRLLEFFRSHYDRGAFADGFNGANDSPKVMTRRQGRALRHAPPPRRFDWAAAIEEGPPCFSGCPLREFQRF